MSDIKAKITQSGLLKGSTSSQRGVIASKVEVNTAGINLGDLSDVTITSPTDGSYVVYQSSSNTFLDDQTIVKTATGINLTGTLEADAITVNGITLAETISDTVGNMITDSNTESGIAVTYDDSDNTLDFNVDDFSITLTGDVAGSGTVTNLGNVSFETTIQPNSVALGTDTTGDYVGTITGGTGIDSNAATSGEGTTHTLSVDLNELSTETSIAQADFITMVDATDDGSGKITFSNLEDTIFSNVSGDIAIAAGGAATIQATSVENSMLAGSISNDKLAGSITNAKLANSSVSFGGVSVALGAGNSTPAFDLQDATGYLTSSLVGTITDAQLAGSITTAKLAGSITNDKLSNSSITISDGSNTSPVALGGTLTFAGTSNEVTVVENTGTITVGLPDDVTIAGDLSVSTAPTSGAHVTNKTYVDAQVANVVDSAPAALDTLNELAAALGDDANFATTTATALGNRLRIDVNNQSLNATQKTNALTNLGLGTAATTAASAYATSAQGSKADTALQPTGTLTGKIQTTQTDNNMSGLTINAGAAASGSIAFKEGTDNGTNTVTLQGAATVASDVTITLPSATGTVITTGNISDLGGNQILFANMYATEGDLPSATTYHGMFAHVHATGKGYFAHANAWHKLLDESSSTADDLTEGSTNLYYTDARVATKLATSVGNIVTTGHLRGPATFYIDPAADDTAQPGGDTTDTGEVQILGDLKVTGANFNAAGLNLTLAKGSTNKAGANGAGITIDCGSDTDATITYVSASDHLASNKSVDITGNLKVSGTFKDSSGDTGTNGQVLLSTSTGTNWGAAASTLTLLADDSSDADDSIAIDLLSEKFTVAGGTGINTSKATDNQISVALETVSGLSAGQYGAAGTIPQITVDATGRVTAIGTVTGQTGPMGPSGATTFSYLFNTETSFIPANDPGTEKIKVDNANLTQATKIGINHEMNDTGTTDIEDFLDTVIGPTSAVKGHVKLSKRSDPSRFVLYEITGGSNFSSNNRILITYATGNITSFNNNEEIFVSFSRTGDAGSGSSGSVRTVSVDTNGDGTTDNTLDANETLVLKAGSNVTLAEASGIVTINSSGGGSGGSADEVTDADGDTLIQVEKSADEDIIRFDVAGTELMTLDANELKLKSTDLKLTGSGTGSDLSSKISADNSIPASSWKNTGKKYSHASAGKIHFNSSGTTAIMSHGVAGRFISKITLSTAYDLSTGSHTSTAGGNTPVNGTSSSTNITAVEANSDGSIIYMVNLDTSDNSVSILKHTPSTNYGPDLGTLAAEYNTTFATTGVVPRAICFKSDGSALFTGGVTSTGINHIVRYNLSTDYDISTVVTGGTLNGSGSYHSAINLPTLHTSHGLGTSPNLIDDIAFSADGKSMYVIDGTTDVIYSYTLSTGWDLSSTVTPNGVFKIKKFATEGISLHLNSAQDFAVISNTGDALYQFSVDNDAINIDAFSAKTKGSLTVGDELTVDGNVLLTGSVNVSSIEAINITTDSVGASTFNGQFSILPPAQGDWIEFNPGDTGILNISNSQVGDAPPESILLPDGHGLKTGDEVLYDANGNSSAIGGIDNNIHTYGSNEDRKYAFVRVTGNYIQLHRTKAESINNVSRANLQGSGFSGTHLIKTLSDEIRIGSKAQRGGIHIGNSIGLSGRTDLITIGGGDKVSGAIEKISIGVPSSGSAGGSSGIIDIGSHSTAVHALEINIGSSTNVYQTQPVTVNGTFSVLPGSQASRTITLGSATQTGAITLGQSTKGNTINIGNGATESGQTQAINIGASGVSGSTTTIKIGKFTIPAADGSANQVLKTDGNGNLAFVNQSSGNAIAVKDEGTSLTTAASTIDFVGAGVTATESSGTVTVTVPGGGGSSTPQTTVTTFGWTTMYPMGTTSNSLSIGTAYSTSTAYYEFDIPSSSSDTHKTYNASHNYNLNYVNNTPGSQILYTRLQIKAPGAATSKRLLGTIFYSGGYGNSYGARTRSYISGNVTKYLGGAKTASSAHGGKVSKTNTNSPTSTQMWNIEAFWYDGALDRTFIITPYNGADQILYSGQSSALYIDPFAYVAANTWVTFDETKSNHYLTGYGMGAQHVQVLPLFHGSYSAECRLQFRRGYSYGSAQINDFTGQVTSTLVT